MKLLLSLLALSALSTTNAQRESQFGMEVFMTCKDENGSNCKDILQKKCGNGENEIENVTFDPLMFCVDNSKPLNETRSYLWLRGAAIKFADEDYEGDTAYAGKEVLLSAMSKTIGDSGCLKYSYSTPINVCKGHFNAELFGWSEKETGVEEYFGTKYNAYMKRLCNLEAKVTCTQGDTPCETITQCSNQALDYTYEFCISTKYSKHEIVLDTETDRATEAYTGTYVSGFPGFPELGSVTASDGEKCFTKTLTRTTCETNKIPSATVRATGSVEKLPSSAPNVVDGSYFQECFAEATIEAVTFGAGDPTPPGPPSTPSPGSPSKGKGKGSKSPSSKTKSPGKGGKGSTRRLK